MAEYVFYFTKTNHYHKIPMRLLYIDDCNRRGKTDIMRQAIKKIRSNPFIYNDKHIRRLPNEWFFEGNRPLIARVYLFIDN